MPWKGEKSLDLTGKRKNSNSLVAIQTALSQVISKTQYNRLHQNQQLLWNIFRHVVPSICPPACTHEAS